MRHLALFLVAFGAASLAVQGQDEEGADLLDRIDELTRELEGRLVAREKAERPARPQLRVYEVSDLVMPLRDAAIEPANLRPSKYQPPEAEELAEPCAPFEIDVLIDVIRSCVHPESWDVLEGADIQPKNGRLFVTTVPSVHEGIARLLRGFRETVADQLILDLVAVPVTADALAAIGAHPRELPEEVAARLMAERPLGAVRLVAHDGQQVAQRAGSLRSYLCDYTLSIAEKAAIGEPVRAEVVLGCGAQVRALLDRDARGAMLHLRVDRTRMKDPVRSVETAHGPLDLPVLDLTRLQTSLWVPLERTVVLGGGAHGDSGCLYLATVRHLRP